LFYDARGSALFERITELPEYYLTRAELRILEEHAGEMARALGPERLLLELGSGASRKTRLLLDVLWRPTAYVPVDISPSALTASVAALRTRYPRLEVRPLVADYTRELCLPLWSRSGARGVSVFFPGSTIGNFSPDEAVAFLARVRAACGADQRWLIGVDVPKPAAVLEAAYDDAEGVTAAFNRNILYVLNREYGANFQPEHFAHRATWNPGESRVEMHLVSRRVQIVELCSERFSFDTDEVIVTEYCYKYTREAFRELAGRAGFEVKKVWTDSSELFSVPLLEP
jgi:dimethylhistidine N-methyltransferase